jgi:hypothetical protein
MSLNKEYKADIEGAEYTFKQGGTYGFWTVWKGSYKLDDTYTSFSKAQEGARRFELKKKNTKSKGK